jgi:hypothetical protein
MRFGSRFTRAAAATLLGLGGATGGLVGSATAGATTPTYYVAMGDSLGAGTGASPGSMSYVNQIYSHELSLHPGLQLENFSCGGATTSSVVHGGNCGSPTTQLATAEAFLQAHPGQVALLTIDIGANDVDGCSNGTTIDNTCLANGLSAIKTNLPLILASLKAAYPGIRMFGMNYYDPFLASWLSGPAGQTLARQSVTQADAFNTILASLYTTAGFPTADVATAFQSDDFSLTGTYNSATVPQNVADICNWTYMCVAGDIHANNIGHAALAQAFEPLIDAPLAPGPPSAPLGVTAAAGNARATLRWIAPARNNPAATGYVVTPYLGSIAQPTRTFNAAATTEPITGLVNAKTYTFRVAAKNAVGTGPQSAATGAVTVGAPAPPTAVKALSGSTTTATGSLVVTFAVGANNGAAITKFTATCASGNGGVAKTGVRTGAIAAPITVVGVTTAKTYTCRVTATNSRGTSLPAPASSAIVVGAPGPPTNPQAAPTLAGWLKVSFLRPANNGAAITNYTATCMSTNGGLAASKTALPIPMTVTGLTPGKTYRCTVRATNGRGAGPASVASSPVTA